MRSIEKEEVYKMLKAEVIEPRIENRVAAPIVFAPRRDGTLRFCVDYRRLNAMSVRDAYSLP